MSRVLRRGSVGAVQVAAVKPIHEMPLLGDDGRRFESAVAEARDTGYREGHEAGYRDGYLRGEQEARQAVEEKGRRHLVTALLALEAGAEELRRRDELALADIEPELIALVLSITEALLGRELASVDAPARDALVRALALVPERGAVRAFFHPDDVGTIGATADVLPGREIELVSDPSIERGACVVEVGACRVDAQLAPALERVRAVLRSQPRDVTGG